MTGIPEHPDRNKRSEAYNAFRVPHFLLLNLAVGGMLGGKVDRSALPAEYLVDYVRVYQKTE